MLKRSNDSIRLKNETNHTALKTGEGYIYLHKRENSERVKSRYMQHRHFNQQTNTHV